MRDDTGARAAALLADPLRRTLYDAVAAADAPLSRDDAARVAGVAANLAGYHLDQLEDAGLLVSSFARRTGRTGPGAGRPAKHYRRAETEVTVQIPARDDAFLAGLLASAVETDTSGSTRSALLTAAERAGQQIGQAAAGPGLIDVLDARGYEPRREPDGTVVLRNCPFHHLMPQHLQLVCGLNEAFLTAVATAAKAPVTAVLDPQPGRCCVVLRPTPPRRSAARR